MGQIKSKPKVELTVSATGYITKATPLFLLKTGYEYKDIHQKHLADILLTGVLARLHKKIFIPKFNKATGKEKARLRNFIKNHMSKLMCTISTPNGIQKVFVSTVEVFNGDLCITFRFCVDSELTIGSSVVDNVPPLLRECSIFTSPTLHAEEVGIISMDLYGSTNYINEVGIGPYVASQKTLFAELHRHLLIEFFPLVQLHEVLGDSFIMTVNSPWWCHARLDDIKPFLILVAKYLTYHLNKICDRFYNGKIHIRCGITFGSVVANITGRYFRLYGECLNIACRLESLCEKNHIHILDDDGNECELKGFDEPFKTTQIPCLECPSLDDIYDLIKEPDAFMSVNDDRTKSFHRSKNIFTTKRPSQIIHTAPTKYAVKQISRSR
jgi:hypothetical protein